MFCDFGEKMLSIGLGRPLVVLVVFATSFALASTVYGQDVSCRLSNPASMLMRGGTPSTACIGRRAAKESPGRRVVERMASSPKSTAGSFCTPRHASLHTAV